MADTAALERALRNAHAAGDTAAAARFAAELRKSKPAEPSRADQLQAEFDALPTYMKPIQAAGDLLRTGSDALTFGALDQLRVMLGTQPDIETARQGTQDASTRAGVPGDIVEGVSAMIPMLAMPEVAIPARAGPVLQQAGRMGVSALEGMGFGGIDAVGHDEDVSEGMIAGGAFGALGSGLAGVLGKTANKIGDWWDGGIPKTAAADLRLAKDRAYNAMEDENVMFTPTAVDELTRRIRKSTKDAYPGVQEGVIQARKRAERNLTAGGRGFQRSRSMTEIDKERQNFRRDAVNHPISTNKGMGLDAVNTIDEWLVDATQNPAWVSSRTGKPEEALGLLRQGRELNTRLNKLEPIEEMIGRGERQAARSINTGEDSAIKNNLARIYDDPKMREQYTPEELKQMEVVNEGTAAQKVLRQSSRLAPGKGLGWQGAATGGGLGFMIGGPVGATIGATVPAIAGILAGKASSRATKKEAEKLRNMVASGKSGKTTPVINSKAQRELARLLTALGITYEED